MSSNPIFTPVQTSEAKIQDLDLQHGWLYFATDTGRMYLDTEDERISVGGIAGGVSIYYGDVEEPVQDETTELYSIPVVDVKDGPAKKGDLILNSDGGFYKVESITEEYYICTLLSISGVGGGGSVVKETKPTIKFTVDRTNLINGQEAYFTVEGKSAMEADNVTPIDTTLYVTYALGTRITQTVVNNYYTTTITCPTDETGAFKKDIEFGSHLKESASSVLSVYIWGGNHDAPSSTRTADVSASALKLSQLSSYTPANTYSAAGFTLSCNVIGSIDKIVKFYYDNVLTDTRSIGYKTANSNPNFTIPAGAYENGQPVEGTATHGYHKVKIELCQDLGDGQEGLYTEPLEYEIAVVGEDASLPPVIWLGDYKSVYYTYDTIQIPFLVYDPASTGSTVVHLYKDKIEQEGSPRTITDFADFTYWEITDATFDQQNTYQISCGETEDRYVEREIGFTIEVDPNRTDFQTESGNLKLNFMATGRSNSESKAKRQTWSYTLDNEVKTATFTDFNWYNNGWMMDKEINQTCLRISNGAQLSIPYKSMTFASNNLDSQSHTVELQFRIRNIQNYDNLIKNITRYKFGEGDDAPTDDTYYEEFKVQKDTGYDNYDAFLQWRLTPEDYEKLAIWKVEKVIQVDNVVAGLYDYYNNTAIGFCVGTQDAFFSNGSDTVNVNFVENDLINLSFVYQHSLKQLYIYINGCITGVIKSSYDDDSTFSIANSNFVFKSDTCDIDLYKLRIYQTDLNVNQIVKNFAVDRKDITTFDQNALAEENITLKEYQFSYANMLKYNEEHPDAPLMPYIIFDTGGEDSKLPYSKDDDKKISVEFVNVPLDQAYLNGELEKLAREDGLISENEVDGTVIAEAVKKYYKYHCPSFTSSIRTSDKVNFEVQGTSSEFYPRRNYKIKTKMEGKFNWKDNADLDEEDQTDEGGAFTEEEALNIFMHKGPYAEVFLNDQAKLAEDTKYLGYEESRLADGWYMNNYTNPTDRWTMKVDYMESSGSYNAGFASMVGNGYTKHPLQDYLGVLGGVGNLKPVEPKAIASDDGMRWQDYRTSLLGFPVMAFWKRGSGDSAIYTFIGYYRMLLDKSSTQVLGFKTPKKVVHKLFPYVDDEGNTQYKRLRDVAECWEFSNNARGYCSYRDPWNRVELSFKPPVGVANEYTDKGAPIVANSFEYRYHSKDDYIDTLYAFDQASQADLNEVAKELGLPANSIIEKNRASGADALLTTHVNWEKVCKWLWSTNVDAVESQGTYKEIPVGDIEYKTDGTFFVINENNEFVASTEAFNKDKTYYIANTGDDKETNPYIEVNAAPAEYVFEVGKFYYLAAGGDTESTDDDIYTISYDAFDGSIKYYEFIEGDESSFNTRFDLLVRPVNTTKDTYNSNTQYYTWHGTEYDANDVSKRVVVKKGSATGAVRAVETPNETDWAAGKYYVANPTTYAGITYTHDTKEYRIAKFTNEFERHFDPEYVATYFVMTEVMECYDSRGKNCMMASWGPKEEWLTDGRGNLILDDNGEKIPGEYIWYPIFYDIDTQLGINNTGIPSFEYNVDATEAGNYSTSDSILWNNFYKFFKNTWMLPKYQNLRGIDTKKFDKLYDIDGITSKAPLQSVDYIEKWYTFNPNTYHNIACRGVKPLIATNLDLYFKYITITNAAAISQGVAKLDRNGKYAIDPGTYFYALQGDRSQSRRQFVTNRLEYIDSWLTQGNYARAGTNCLWGRISANNRDDLNSSLSDVHSDKWTESGNDYWENGIEFGKKTHEFDAEYWLELKPIRSAYVTAGDDSANYPSEKYDGIHDMKFKLNELENGIRTSNNYPEQLLYIYGINQMSDLGDLSKMYWTEFKIEGEANRLTRLKLGHDGLTYDFKNGSATEKTWIKWYNNKINSITWENSLPLLKNANFSNLTITGAVKSMDLTGSEKLENFRATGSNLTSVGFADGVALNTLYYPATATSLSLVQANLLTDLILPPRKENDPDLPAGQKYYTTPVMDETIDDLRAESGLYLEGFFDDNATCALNGIKLDGGNLGYNSYTILERMWKKNNGKGVAKITMTDVDWCPYTQLTEGAVYDDTKAYYKDNGHYGFVRYNGPTQVLAGQTYDSTRTYYTLNADNEFIRYTGGSTGFNDAVASGLYVDYVYDKIQFNADILSGLLYIDNGHGGRNEDGTFGSLVTSLNDSTITLLKTLYTNQENFVNAAGQNHAELSGYIYIHNNTAINESDIITLQSYYPNAVFFFANVNKAYSARFVQFNEEDYSEKYVKWMNGSTSPSVQKIQTYSDSTYFTSPFDIEKGYKPEKTHHDFIGWSLNNRNPYDENGKLLDSVITVDKAGTWNNQKLTEGIYDYTYYAIFELHKYEIKCYNNNDTSYGEYTNEATNQKYHMITIEYGQPLSTTGIPMPQASDATELEERNTFKGWTLNKNYGKVYGPGEDLSEIIAVLSKYSVTKDYELYAVFQNESVYDSNTDSKYFIYTYDSENGYPIVNLNPENGNDLSGKITIPALDPNGVPVLGIGLMVSYNKNNSTYPDTPLGQKITHIFFDKAGEFEFVEACAFRNPEAAADSYSLTGVYLPDTIRVLKDRCFEQMTHITQVTLNDEITTIGSRAFRGQFTAPNGVNITKLPAKLVSLGAEAFYKCNNLKISELPQGIKRLEKETFRYCENMTLDEFGQNGLTYIGDSCFANAGQTAGAVSAIYLHNSVTGLGSKAFQYYGSSAGPEMIYTTLALTDSNVAKWDAQNLTGNANAQISGKWNGVR